MLQADKQVLLAGVKRNALELRQRECAHGRRRTHAQHRLEHKRAPRADHAPPMPPVRRFGRR